MHKFKRFHQLVDDVFLVDLLQNVGSNDGVEVCLCVVGRTIRGNRKCRY